MLCAGVLALAAPISADVLLSNLPPPNDNGQTAALGPQRRKAMAFSMPSGRDYTLTAMTLRLNNFDPGDTAILELRAHTGSNSTPGSDIVATFVAPIGAGPGIGEYVFTASGPVTLSAATSYWIYLYGAGAPPTFDWKASTPGIDPTIYAVFGPGNLFSTDGGTTWTTSLTIPSFRLEATPVGGFFCCVDFNGDEEIDFADIEGFLAALDAQIPGNCKPGADFNDDGEFDFTDIESFLALFNEALAGKC